MDKAYIDVNGEETAALPSGGGSSIGSQWEAGLDLDVAQAIITSSIQKQGYKSSLKNAGDIQNGEMSLEEEVNSLDLKQVVIDDDEIKEMEKEQANAATAAAATAVGGEQMASEQLNTRVFSLVDEPTQREDMPAEDSNHATSDNDLLNDIDSLIAPSLSPVHDGQVNGWLEMPDWTADANGRLNVGNRNAEWGSGQGKGKYVNKKAVLSPSSSTSTDPHLQFGKEATCQCSPSSTLLLKSPSTVSDVSCQQGNTHSRAISPKDSSGIDVFQASPVAHNSQGANSQGKILPQSEMVSAESEENIDADAGCRMCPVKYDDDDDDGESNDLDEHFSSGELIPHGRGSGRGRPKSAQPIRNSVPCEIRPKTDIPTYSNNLIPVIVRKDDNKNCIELHPVVCQASHNSSPSISSGIQSGQKKTASPSIESNLQPDSTNSTSMERVERDGPVSLIGAVHHVPGQGHIPQHILHQNLALHSPGYRAVPQLYNGSPLTHQSMQPQPAMNHYIPNHLQQADIREQINLQQYQEEPQYQYGHKQTTYPPQAPPSYKNLPVQNSSSGICMAGHQTMVSNQPSIPAYQEIRPEPSRMATSYYTSHPSEGSNLVVADPKQLEKAGIPFRIVSQASVSNLPAAQSVIQTTINSAHSHRPFLPQPLYSLPDIANTRGNSQMYQQGNVLAENRAAAQIMEQPVYNQLSKGGQPSHSRGHPQQNTQAAYYSPPPVTSNVPVESVHIPSTRIIYPVQQRQPVVTGHGTILSPAGEPDIPSPSSKVGGSGMRKLVRASPIGSDIHVRNRLDCRGIPKEEKKKRTEDWILQLQSSKIPNHHMRPYETNRHMVSSSDTGPELPPKAVGLFQGNEIADLQPGLGFKKSSGNVGDSGKHKGVKKGRSSGRVKEVDTASNHLVYINKLPGKVQAKEIPGRLNQERENFNKARPSSNGLVNLDTQSDRIVSVQNVNNSLRNHIPEHLNVTHGETQLHKTRSVGNDFTEVDKEIEKIMFEKRIRENQANSTMDPLQQFSAMFDEPLFDYPIPSDAVSKNSQEAATNSASQTKSSSQTWNIDPSQYLSAKDKESLEKKIHIKNNSLEKYLRMGKTNNDKNVMGDPNSQAYLEHCLMSPEGTQELSTHFGKSLLNQQLDHNSHSQIFTQLPKETAKIDILAWRQQSALGGQEIPLPPVPRPGAGGSHFDIANPSAQDFPHLLQSLTAFGDEDMRSASLELSGSFRNPADKEYPNPSHGHPQISTTPCPPQYHLSHASAVHSNLPANVPCDVPPTSEEQCFRKPHHPAIKQPFPANFLLHDSTNMHSQQTSLSACISHTEPLMASSVALASSQPVSSIKGDSDVSMQSDLSRRSRQDRSMSSVDGKLQQIPEFYKQPQPAAAVVKDKSNSSHCNHRKTSRVKEWLENQVPFLDQSDGGKLSGFPKKGQDHVKIQNAITSNIPNHLDCIDHQELQQQHLAARQQKSQQEHVIFQQIPPPSSPQLDMNSPFQDDIHDELDFDPYVVPGFSPSDLLPRCGSGNSDKPPSRPKSGSQVIKGQGPTPTCSSNSQVNGAEKSRNHIPVSVLSSVPLSSKETHLNQKSSKNGSATSLATSRPKSSATPSSLSHVPSSSPSVSSRPAAVVDSNSSPSDSSRTVKSKQSSVASSAGSSHKSSDMHKVGERIKTSVKISQTASQHREGAAVDDRDKDEEDEDDVEVLGEEEEKGEEEELSFTGSDVFRPDDQGETILHCLCDIPPDKFDFEELASAPGFEEAVNSSNKAQETPLFVGVHNRRSDVTRFLMKKGADASIACISPANTFRNEPLLQSAIHEAAELGDAKTLFMLIQSEDVDIDLPRPGSGQTPLMVALHIHSFAHRNSSANRTRVIKLLLEQGASMTIQDAVEGKTPFMYAIQSRDVEIVNTFFRLMDADEARDAVTTKTSRSATCLHFAAGLSNFDRSQKMELIRILILNGADTSSKNAEGETPRDWAREEIDEVLKKLVPGR